MKTTQTLDIGEVAQASGIAPSALRFYEQKGLIRSIGRQGLRRVFNKTVLDQLAFITLGQRAGFTLNEIKNMVHADGSFEIDRTLLLERADSIDSKIKELLIRNKVSEYYPEI